MKPSIVLALFFLACSSVKGQAKPGPHIVDTLPTVRWNTGQPPPSLKNIPDTGYADVIINGQEDWVMAHDLHGSIWPWDKAWNNITYGGSGTAIPIPPDPHSTPRLDVLEKQVQYLLRRTNELEQEIKALKTDTGAVFTFPLYHGRAGWQLPDTTKQKLHLTTK